MKYKLKEAIYNNDGHSYVTIVTELGEFNGYCKLHDEDKDIASEFFGCKIAEMRALRKYGQAKINILKRELKVLADLIAGMEQLKDYNKDCHEARYVRKMYFIKEDKLKKMCLMMDNLDEGIYYSMQNYRNEREAMLKKIEEQKSTSEE